MNWISSTKPSRLASAKRAGLFAFILLCLLAMIWVLSVLIQHKVRKLETQYHQALETQRQLEEEWGRLMLEKGHLSAPLRIEQLADKHLQMHSPKSAEIIVVQQEKRDAN